MTLYRALLALTSAAVITSAFYILRRKFSELPLFKNKWSELNEARWLEFRSCCAECLLISGAALLYSAMGGSITAGVTATALSAAAGFLKYKKICNKII